MNGLHIHYHIFFASAIIHVDVHLRKKYGREYTLILFSSKWLEESIHTKKIVLFKKNNTEDLEEKER